MYAEFPHHAVECGQLRKCALQSPECPHCGWNVGLGRQGRPSSGAKGRPPFWTRRRQGLRRRRECRRGVAGAFTTKPARQTRNYFSFDGARGRFLRFFPNGFHSAGYTNAERDYKIAANQRLDETAQPIKPRHQRCVQACRHRQSRGRNCGSDLLRVALALRFQHRLRHFLHEQWDAIGALDNVQPDARGQRLVARDKVDHGGDFPVSKPVECEGGDVRPSNPRRLKLRSVGNDQ